MGDFLSQNCPVRQLDHVIFRSRLRGMSEVVSTWTTPGFRRNTNPRTDISAIGQNAVTSSPYVSLALSPGESDVRRMVDGEVLSGALSASGKPAGFAVGVEMPFQSRIVHPCAGTDTPSEVHFASPHRTSVRGLVALGVIFSSSSEMLSATMSRLAPAIIS
jgi:hypothetical protein